MPHRAYMVQAELHEDDEILIENVVLSRRPTADAGAASGLVGVFAASIAIVDV